MIKSYIYQAISMMMGAGAGSPLSIDSPPITAKYGVNYNDTVIVSGGVAPYTIEGYPLGLNTSVVGSNITITGVSN